MTPNDIEVLIHFYVSPNPHPRQDAPAVKEAMARFVSYDILRYRHGAPGTPIRTEVTRRGDALIKMLCNTPLPKIAWVDAAGNVISQED